LPDTSNIHDKPLGGAVNNLTDKEVSDNKDNRLVTALIWICGAIDDGCILLQANSSKTGDKNLQNFIVSYLMAS
jgi:hypothetical protein